MLRVLHVAETLPGGIATYLRELVPLQAADPTVEQVRVLAPQNQLSHLSEIPSHLVVGYIRSGRNPISLLNLAMALRRQTALFQPHIVHLHSSFAGAIGRAMRPFLPKDVKLVYCPHGWGFSRDENGVARQIYAWLELWLAHFADAWIAISRHEAKAASAVGIDTNHMWLIHNGIGEAPKLTAAPLAADSQYLNLLFVGRHDRQKGLDVLLAAMGQLTDLNIRLHVVGAATQGKEQDRPDLKNVTWLGWCSGAELIAQYRACDAVVMPSRWEGFSLVALEAMREGRAVIASQHGSLAEAVGDCGAYFPIDDLPKLVQLLRNQKKEQLATWGRQARRRYEALFRSERMHREILMLYQALRSEDSCVS